MGIREALELRHGKDFTDTPIEKLRETLRNKHDLELPGIDVGPRFVHHFFEGLLLLSQTPRIRPVILRGTASSTTYLDKLVSTFSSK